MQNPFVTWLKDIDGDGFALVGGKAMSLGRLIKSGLPIPAGFCITTEAYRHFIYNNDLEYKIADVIGDIDIANLQQLSEGSRGIEKMITAAEMSRHLIKEIAQAYNCLGHSSVAVRSSATAEDTPEASFAGQQDSYLNVIGQEYLLKRIKQCWASLWTPRAIQYRAQRNIDNSNIYMAVIVQEMAEADVAGVMFTINPTNNDQSHMVISAAYGLGEIIVDGDVTPDTFILDKTSLRILQREVSLKEIMAVSDTQGGTRRVQVDTGKQELPSLPDHAIRELGMIGKQVEVLFSSPQDIEWAYSRGQIFLLQSRPVTSQSSIENVASSQPTGLRRLILSFLLDYFPFPPFHFDRSLLLSLIDITLQLVKPFGLKPPRAIDILKEEEEGTLSLSPILPRFTWQLLPSMIRGLAQAFMSLRVDPNIWVKERWPKVAKHIDELRKRDVSGMTDKELLNFIRDCATLRDVEIFASRLDYFYGGWIAMITLPVILKAIERKESNDWLYNLMLCLDHPTAAINLHLRKLARLAASLPKVHSLLKGEVSSSTWPELETQDEGQVFLEELTRFLSTFGARTEALIALPSLPTWEEKPHIVLSLVAATLQDPKLAKADSEKSSALQFEDVYQNVLRKAGRLSIKLLGIQYIFPLLVNKVRAMATERDWIIFAYELANRPVRQSMNELGKRLALRGKIRKPNDIRFLSLHEAESVLLDQLANERLENLRQAINKRKFARPNTIARWKMPVPLRLSKTRGNILLNGIAASPGIATGPATIVWSESEFAKLKPGALLICRATNPSWTPLFAIAAGVVADIGGPLSHAAIVAREYGIPAVLNTQNATTVMKNTVTYIVDGTQGQVLKVDVTE